MLWDFEGTLAWRPGLWGACVLEVLDEEQPGHGAELDQIRTDLRGGFPWHRPEQPHARLSDPEAWWAEVTPLLTRAITRHGIEAARAGELAKLVRERFVDGSRGWLVFDDTRPALELAASRGWRNAILSNHVPELPELVSQLGLGDLFDHVFTSATIGYEKPNPEAFRHALRECGEPEAVFMVGDNPIADVAGAQALGIPAILVRDGRRGGDAFDAAAAAAAIVGAKPGRTSVSDT